MNGSTHRALLSLSIAIAMSVVCVGSSAQTVKLYKVIDKDGRVTYLDHPPEPGAGYVEEKDIDVGTNITESVAIPAPTESGAEENAAPDSEGSPEATETDSAQAPPLLDTSLAPAAATESAPATTAPAARDPAPAASGVGG
ncbi:MAG: hypothetical protein OEQ39_19125 [Gammaproteobacteria bacterium]|nr:hypothetical protein [Gammaproteobacteria bacterium]MDH3465782.1 hypothetical protein [Gammaproteobacteria bacterium]